MNNHGVNVAENDFGKLTLRGRGRSDPSGGHHDVRLDPSTPLQLPFPP